VAAKTVSNEKTRVLQKLRDALMDHELNESGFGAGQRTAVSLRVD
jgi:hypothetical protein